MPLWVRIAATVWVCVLVPTYIRSFGPANFLWFSDLSLFMTCIALWLNNRRLASMAIISVFPLEVVWNLGFFLRLFTGYRVSGLADYMFDPRYSFGLRALSLFHVWLIPLWIWMLRRMGYDRRAWPAQAAVGWAVLLLTYVLTTPNQNINWVFGPGGQPQQWMPPLVYLAILMVFFPLCVYLPTHLILKRLPLAVPR